MALTYTPFITALSQSGGSQFPRTINVSSWQETTEWQGQLRPAFDGTLLSTLRTPKRRYQATFEFATGADYETFLSFIAFINPNTQFMAGLRKMVLVGFGTESSIRNKILTCYIRPGSATPTEEVVNNAVVLHWAVEMTILEA